MMVKDIIKDGEWNFEGMEDSLDEEDKMLIKSVKIPEVKSEDQPIWRRSRDGRYYVKIGYKEALDKELEKKNSEAGSSYSPSSRLWKRLWSIKSLPKIKNFMWRALKGALATKEALYNRKCARSPTCPICQARVESVEHLLLLCPWARQCWYASPLTLRCDEGNMVRLDRWMEEWMCTEAGLDEYGCAIFAATCWEIWKARCKFIYEKRDPDAGKCIQGAIRIVNEQTCASEKGKRRREKGNQTERKMKWEAPEWGKAKMNVDAAFNHKTKKGAIGVIGRDWNGRFMGGISKRIEVDSAFQAECFAILEAIKSINLWGNEGGELESDCAEVVERIQKNKLEGCEWGSKEVLKMCMDQWMEERHKNWKLSLVARKGNKAADCLAAAVMGGVVPQGWLNQPPPSLIQIMEEDMNEARHENQTREGVG